LALPQDRGGVQESGADHVGRDGKYVGLAAIRQVGETEEVVDGGGLLGGVTAYHLRMLCESEWNGGAGYAPEQVGRMTLDQICFRLCEASLLKRDLGERTDKMEPLAAAGMIKPDEDGMVKGRAADGTPIRGRIRGKSKARELMELEERKQRKEKRRRRRKR